AGNDDVGLAPADVVHSVNECRSRSCACGYRCKVRSHKSVLNRNPSGRNINDHFGDEERIDTRRSVAQGKSHDLLLESLKSAVTGPPDNADTRFVNVVEIKTGVFQRFRCRYQRVLCEWINLSYFLLLEI